MELLCRPNLEETEEHVSVLEAKKEPHSACNASQDWTKATIMLNIPIYNNEPLFSPTTSSAIESTPEETLPISSHHKDSTENPPAGANHIQDSPSMLVTESVSTAAANPAFISDYTTMELFQQITKTVPPAPSSAGAAFSHRGQEYLRQPLSLSKDSGAAPDQMCLTDGTENPFP